MIDPGYSAACDRAVTNLRNEVNDLVDYAASMVLDHGPVVAVLRLGVHLQRGDNTATELANVLAAAAVRLALPPAPELPPLITTSEGDTP